MKKSVKGLKWINNGINNKRVKENELEKYLQDGWKIGQLPTTVGHIWINKDGKNTTIKKDKLKTYLDKGWSIGKIPSEKEKNYVLINKDDKVKRINIDELDKYLSDGWIKGNINTSNFRWINNLKEEKWTNEELLNGWFLGRLVKNPYKLISVYNDEHSIQIEKYLLQTYISKGYKKGKGKKVGLYEGSTKNTIWINKDGLTKLIKKEDLNTYLDLGYNIGSLHLKNHVHIHKNNSIKFIEKDKLDKYLKDGYELGTGNSCALGKKLLQKDSVRIFVNKEDIEKYLNNGWDYGKYDGAVLGKISIHKNNKSIFIYEDDLKNYLDNGWHCGRKENNRKISITNGKDILDVSLDSYNLNYKNSLEWHICVSSSTIENDFKKLLDLNKIDYKKEFYINFNEKRYFYDFKIDNILIELNPSPTHNVTWSPFGKTIDEDYHYLKSKAAIENRYRCICIWDWDNIDKLIYILKNKERVYARKCDIKKINKFDAKNFINKYHFQDYAKDSIRYGLYYNDELISVMTFGKPRYNKNYEYELIRYCSSKNVIGGSEKLFKHFLNDYNPRSIISYCDLSKFTGKLYEKLGFIYKNFNVSRHWYNIKTDKHITDNLLRQRGFDQLLGKEYGYFGKGTSNEQLMLDHGFVEIYDCGQSTYTWEK